MHYSETPPTFREGDQGDGVRSLAPLKGGYKALPRPQVIQGLEGRGARTNLGPDSVRAWQRSPRAGVQRQAGLIPPLPDWS